MQQDPSVDSRSPFSARLRRLLRLTLAQALSPSVFPVALLIDGDNHSDMSSELLAQIFVEAGKFGAVTIRRVYGNWRAPTMDRWKDLCLHYGLEPVYYPQTTAAGKNAADIALALDALDLLRCNGITHFCLVASDSDYLPLVRRLRENGGLVIVIGKATTLPVLIKASTVFVALEHLAFTPSKPAKSSSAPLTPAVTTTTPLPSAPTSSASGVASTDTVVNTDIVSPAPKLDAKLTALLLNAYEQAAKEEKNEWVSIQKINATLIKLDSKFKLSAYKYKHFKDLFQAYSETFETRKQKSGLAIRKRT